MGRRIYLIPKSVKVEDALADALANNCPEIVSGVPPGLAGIIDEASLPCAYEEPEPPGERPALSTHWATIDSFLPGATKPMRVKRTWNGREYTVDCFVTEAVKDQYLAGDIAVGDFVLVHFLEAEPEKAIVIAKVYKTW